MTKKGKKWADYSPKWYEMTIWHGELFTVPVPCRAARRTDARQAATLDSTECCMEDYKFILKQKELFQLFIASDLRAKQAARFQVVVKNQFEVPLTSCRLTLEGQGMGHVVKEIDDIAVGGEVKVGLTLNPSKSGEKTIAIDLDSKEITDVKGFYTVKVESADGGYGTVWF